LVEGPVHYIQPARCVSSSGNNKNSALFVIPAIYYWPPEMND
jgi:hypothetical protein